MRHFKEYQGERLLMGMMMLELLSIFFPQLLPTGCYEIILLCTLLLFILNRIRIADLACKRKYN